MTGLEGRRVGVKHTAVRGKVVGEGGGPAGRGIGGTRGGCAWALAGSAFLVVWFGSIVCFQCVIGFLEEVDLLGMIVCLLQEEGYFLGGLLFRLHTLGDLFVHPVVNAIDPHGD